MKPTFVNEHERKVQSARISLLIFIILSALNLFLLYFADMAFTFSCYLSWQVTSIGAVLAMELEMEAIYFIFGFIAALLIVPYLLCFIFYKKHVAWPIVSLVLVSLDTLLVLIDTPSLLSVGYTDILYDLLFHAVIVVGVAIGIRAHFENKKAKAEAEVLAKMAAEEAANAAVTEDGEPAPEVEITSRTITVTRKKSFNGMAAKMTLWVDGVQVLTLKNGETASFEAPSTAFRLDASIGLASGSVSVPANEGDIRLEAAMKMGFSVSTVSFTFI